MKEHLHKYNTIFPPAMNYRQLASSAKEEVSGMRKPKIAPLNDIWNLYGSKSLSAGKNQANGL
jgi:hypothetical protein